MGITGLIPFLEKATVGVNIDQLNGRTIVVDSYCLLHKGAFGCADKLSRGEETDVYKTYFMRYVDMMLSHDIKPILVFDGRHLPAKAMTESRRRETRDAARKQAAELMRLGRYDEGRSMLRRSIDVTHEMALRVIQECRERNVDCIVAPYEADAQMAWLNKVGLAHYIVTEDSDLLLFGAKNVIFKLDLTGAGQLVEADKLHLAMKCRPERYTFDKFRRMCILSGCDYLDSLPGIGLSKARKFIMMTEEDDMKRALKKIPQYLKMTKLEVTEEYIENFLKAEATFNHMYIFNPLERKMQRLHELSDFNTEERFCDNAGTLLDDEQAFQLALGNLDPFTLKQLDDWHPDRPSFAQASSSKKKPVKSAKHMSIWQTNGSYEPYTDSNASSSVKKAAGNSCALYFKKVDFITKTIDEDITANLRAENAKPLEAEIYSMYRSEATVQQHSGSKQKPPAKRLRSSNSSSLLSIDSVEEEDSNKPTTSTKCHNPFARTQEQLHQSPFSDNLSMLGSLSPKAKMSTAAAESLKQKLATVGHTYYGWPKVEVKSRLFATNVQQVKAAAEKMSQFSTADSDDSDDLSDAVVLIETTAQIHQQYSSQLYRSPSPINEAVKSDASNANKSVAKDAEGNGTHTSGSVLTLSDTETEPACITPLVPVTAKPPRQLGLRKNRKGVAKKRDMTGKTQTDLGMFGFKRRPAL